MKSEKAQASKSVLVRLVVEVEEETYREFKAQRARKGETVRKAVGDFIERSVRKSMAGKGASEVLTPEGGPPSRGETSGG